MLNSPSRRLLILSLGAVSFLLVKPLNAESLEAFIARIIAADSLESPEDYSYIADETVIIYDDAERVFRKGVITSRKKYTIRNGDSLEVEILSMHIEGDSLPKDKQNSDGDRGGRLDPEDLPFKHETLKDYNYEDNGSASLNGVNTRKISFRPKKRSKDRIEGTAWFDPKTAYIMRMEFQYSKNPLAVKDFRATIEVEYRDGYKFMSFFEMDLRVKLPVLMDMSLSIQQKVAEIEFF